MLVIQEARQIWEMKLFLSGCYLGNGEYLILVSPEHSQEPHTEYKKTLGIETLFGALKSRGFNLEDTRLKEPERISRLLSLQRFASECDVSIARPSGRAGYAIKPLLTRGLLTPGRSQLQIAISSPVIHKLAQLNA